MSYEGYQQCLCTNGHYWTVDCYDHSRNDLCPDCGSPIAWENGVDLTNGSDPNDPSSMPVELEVATPAVVADLSVALDKLLNLIQPSPVDREAFLKLCIPKRLSEATYRVPKNQGRRSSL